MFHASRIARRRFAIDSAQVWRMDKPNERTTDDRAQAADQPARDRLPDGGAQRPLGAHRRGGGFRGHLGQRPDDLGVVRRARQQRAVLVAGRRPRRLHGGRDVDSAAARRRHGLRQLQQHASAGAQARAGRCRGRHHRGHAVPKTNSFLRSELQPLADIDEFCGKIKAGKDSQTDADFVLVARVEALIAGWGLAEAIKRAEAYHRAGADAILIHSRQSSPAEIFAFLDEWGNRAPVVLVPTKYWRTPTEDFRARRVSAVIWANHALRASISAMQAAVARIRAPESLIDVEPNVAPLQ